jgi:hypothetical protein
MSQSSASPLLTSPSPTSSLFHADAPSETLADAPVDAQTPTTKRSEVLRYVFPRPSRSRGTLSQRSGPRVTKTAHKVGASNGTHYTSRAAFHRYITSLFSGSHARHLYVRNPALRSRSSSSGSRQDSSAFGSVPSLDMVSPATFIFSGPHIESAGSLSNSASHLPSLAETDSIIELHRARTNSSSMVDQVGLIDDGILEPSVDEVITRTVSKVLLSNTTPIEEEHFQPASLLSDPRRFPSRDGNPNGSCMGTPLSSITTDYASTFATLLMPYLDFSA